RFVSHEIYSGFVCSFFFSSRRRHTRWPRDWSSDVCSSDLKPVGVAEGGGGEPGSCADSTGGVTAWWVVVTGDGSTANARGNHARSEERRVGKGVDIGGRRVSKKKRSRAKERDE